MIVGIGVDSALIHRIEESLQKERFLQRVYGPGERVLIEGRKAPRRYEVAAGNFAAKEAFLKAAGTGLGGFALDELEVLRRESGAPYYALRGEAAGWQKREGVVLHLSITHEGGVATAFCVMERCDKAGIEYL